MKKTLLLSLVALLLSAVALVKVYAPCDTKTEAVAVDVEAVLKDHPEYVIQALQAYEQKAREAAEAQLRALVKDNEAALNADNAPMQGNPAAKVVMVEFYDYACGYCRSLFPELSQVIAKNSDVKVLYRPLAFVSAHSEYAARAVLAANEQGKFSELHTALMTVQKPLSAALVDELAEKVGIDVEKMKADMKSDKVSAAFENNNVLAGNIQISGVPSLIMNGEMVAPVANEIQAKIDAARK